MIEKNEISEKPGFFTNPILPGFYPDPSICGVGDDYYLVTSSFAYFPGIPIFQSRDLVHWKQIAHVLDRPSQLDLDGVEQSQGIFAPTIRYHDGMFYVITTNITKGGNFIVRAANPAGPWSDPFWIENAPGIDPSLFFDDDGRAYYVGTFEVPEGPKYYGDNEIWLQEINLEAMALTGERYGLWRGALKNAIWAEGPHIYKKDGFYYLMIAEGGTGHFHSVTIARSKNVKGPYEGYQGNPILTHRHLGLSYPIVNPGHGDLVRTRNGEWWMVLLASRPYGGYFRNLGRETFLIPVMWENGWPVLSPDTGRVEFSYPLPKLPRTEYPPEAGKDDFDADTLALCWNFLRTPRKRFYSLTDRPGYLRLRLGPEKLTELKNPAFVGRRIRNIDFSARTVMDFRPLSENECAGMVLIQSNRYHFRFERSRLNDGKSNGGGLVRLVRTADGREELLAMKTWDRDSIELLVKARGQNYSFYFGAGNHFDLLAENIDGRILSTDVAGGFTGEYIGLYASGSGIESGNSADFDLFEYSGG